MSDLVHIQIIRQCDIQIDNTAVTVECEVRHGKKDMRAKGMVQQGHCAGKKVWCR